MNGNEKAPRKKCINFRLRLQPLVDSPEGVVYSYLNSQGPRSSKDLIWQVLRMCYLPFAYKERGDLSDEKLKAMALEACNALENYASYIRQMFGLERPTVPFIMNGQNSISPQSQPLPASLPLPEPEPHSVLDIEGNTTPEEMEDAFGDM